MLPTVTMECRAAADPELKFTTSGMAIAKIRCVSASRKKVTEGGEEKWVDDKTCWLDVTCFKKQAENVAESVVKGTLLVVRGRLVTEEWDDKETGAKRSKTACLADDVAISLQFNPAKSMAQQVERQGPASEPVDDPWAAPAPGDEPPF